jgi:hypothetical protein
MDEPRRTVSATPRRAFLRVLVLAPAAAACASAGGAKQSSSPPPAGEQAPARTSVAPGPDALAPVRDFPLPPDAEPAFVFRAAPARPGL